jgi:hypothetical protein
MLVHRRRRGDMAYPIELRPATDCETARGVDVGGDRIRLGRDGRLGPA